MALLKGAFFFWLLTRFRLRARTSLLTSLNLTSFSEFGLIVAAIGMANNWLQPGTLVTLSLILSLSLVIAAALAKTANWIYADYRPFWQRWESPSCIADDPLVDIGETRVAIIGMGRIGTGAYESLLPMYGDKLIGIDSNAKKVDRHTEEGRRVILGDASDADFWDRVGTSDQLELVMLTLPQARTSVSVLRRLDEIAFSGRIAATARFPDEVELLKDEGADTVYNIYTEAGSGFAAHVNASVLAPQNEVS